MDTEMIIKAAKSIEARKKAQYWLNLYGAPLVAKDPTVEVHFTAKDGAKDNGYYEAASLIDSYLSVLAPQAVKMALECCKNDIEIHRAAIKDEIEGDE